VSKRRLRMMSGRSLERRFPFRARTIAVTIAVVAATLAWWLAVPASASRCLAVTGDSGTLLIDVQHLKPGTALKYCWKVPSRSRTVRFVVARRSDGGIAAVLDACRVCYLNNLGYRVSRHGLLCRFCGNRYSISMHCRSASCPVRRLGCPLRRITVENATVKRAGLDC
jgi:uncharacterized membrane protein